MRFIRTLGTMYIGSVLGCVSLLVLAGLWEKGGSFFQALPAAFTLQITVGLPWFLGAAIAIHLRGRTWTHVG